MEKWDARVEKSVSVAIVGGGITGVVLTIALLKHCPGINVTLYESAAGFEEIGAGVGFQPNAVRIMDDIDPRITAAFRKCIKGNVQEEDPPVYFHVHLGDTRKSQNTAQGSNVEEKNEQAVDAKELFTIPAREGPKGGLHRAHFLDELIKLVPDGVAQFRKKLADIAKFENGKALLRFTDGSTAQHDIVLGCDGIKSRTRAILVGEEKAAIPEFTGKYVYRGLIPMDKALEILGEKARTNLMFLGHHGHIITFPIANGTLMNVVAFSSKPIWTDSNWVVQATKEHLREDFKHWSLALRELVENVQKPDTWALFNHLPASTYFGTSPMICLVGDAAHASTPHQGYGAAMCIEDVHILSRLLSRCGNTQDMRRAFATYDAVRRPRTQRIVQTSREAGMLWELEGEGIGDDLEALEKNARKRMDWIWDYDHVGDLQKALNMMKEMVS